jgi:hypothetical protein
MFDRYGALLRRLYLTFRLELAAMSGWSIFSTPFIILLSIPFACFAVFTTTLAFWILTFRLSIVYAQLVAAFAQEYFVPAKPKKPEAALVIPVQEQLPPSRRASRSSSLNSGIYMRSPIQYHNHSRSSVTLTTGVSTRDYEGIGGWRIQADDPEEEALWMGLNSRLELPGLHGHRRRSIVSGNVSPEMVRTPHAATPARGRSHASGTASPEGYFSVPLTGLTKADRSSRVSFSFEDRPRSLHSSTGSLGSIKVTRQDLL